MHDRLILWPVFAMALLTFAVLVTLFVQRVGEMKRERIHPQQLATSAQSASRLRQCGAADNFRNLFELPVLFYVAMLLAYATQQADTLLLVLAWGFVALRALHSFIHCGYNKVMHRFRAYAGSAVVLLALWGVLAYRLLA